MRSDIVPGGIFPDYALPDHTGGRPSFYDLWHDLRAATGEIRPDWDLSTPGLREAWDTHDYSKFHGWDRRSPQSKPTSYEEPGRTR